MNNITIGTILTSKTDSSVKRRVLGICGEVVFLSNTNNYNEALGVYTLKEIDQNYTYPKEQWRPEQDERYYSINNGGNVVFEIWCGDSYDLFRLFIGNVHPTREAALAYKEKMVEKLKEI